ncbi:class I SAM-dependent methyltransferase [Patescibacteria group bacterium]|nr:class I SAM-dependent methyltransferase [Patescibacteria group bacterium]
MNVYEQIFKKYGLSLTQQEILRLAGENRNGGNKHGENRQEACLRNKTVLEIGSSSGYMTRAFLENKCIVDVVEFDQKAVAKLPKGVRRIFNLSIEDNKVYSALTDYDFVIMADVLEHLINPGKVLKKLLKVASFDTKLLISLPNIACWAMRKQLFFKGDFKYKTSGVLDKTHLHFYTVNTLPQLLKVSGWKVDKIIGTVTRLPLEGLISRIPILGWIFRKSIYNKFVDRFKNLSYSHFLVVASKKHE